MLAYNTRIVLIGVSLLGLAAGVVGAFMLLRKRSLVGDAVSHATLPGICLAFVAMVLAGGTGKWLPGLLVGALFSGLAGMGLIILLRRATRLREDALLGIVLSVFFGLGTAMLSMILKSKAGNVAGLESFIYGKTASMVASDAIMIGVVALTTVIASVVLFKEFSLLCFDSDYAAAQGWPVTPLDFALMGMVVVVTVIGLQAVGLILVIALLITPAAAARFWTNRLPNLVGIAGAIGAVSGAVGAAVSATIPKMPAGAVIVLTATAFFVFSLFFGIRRGLLVRWLGGARLSRQIAREHLLRAIWELAEHEDAHTVAVKDLLSERSWTPRQLRSLLRQAENAELVVRLGHRYKLTAQGRSEARRIVRNHRLWELYLITHADVATARVDRGADRIEHVLGTALVDQLEELLRKEGRLDQLPSSPHPLPPPAQG
jgi:manganese/zinc/iron transport system permease protein